MKRHVTSEYLLAGEAVILLASMRIATAVLPFRTTARLQGLKPGRAARPPAAPATRETEVVGWAIRAASSRVPWHSSCLTQALAACVLLRQMRVPATLNLGVANDPASASMIAHAWVESGAAVVVGGEGHRRFTAVATYH